MRNKRSNTVASNNPNAQRFLAYALPHTETAKAVETYTFGGIELDDAPRNTSVSFLDYDGVILLAGSFERIEHGGWASEPYMVCAAPADRDRREREFFTALEQGKTLWPA